MAKVEKLTNSSTGGPVFVYVQDGRIIRVTPMEFDSTDAVSWTIKARGKTFSPAAKDNPLALFPILSFDGLLTQTIVASSQAG